MNRWEILDFLVKRMCDVLGAFEKKLLYSGYDCVILRVRQHIIIW